MHHTDRPIPELPTLDPGIQLLDAEKSIVLHSLVVDHVLVANGSAHWVDAHGHAVTRPLVRLAPSDRVLDRIRVARGFTAFQHYALVERLADAVGEETELLVLPAMDGLYRDDDLRGDEGEELLVRALARVAGLAREHGIPVLVTRTRDDEFAAPIANAAERVIRCEQTPMGPRFVGEAFETQVYPVDRGLVQTTFAFWAEVLAARQPLYEGPSAGVTADGTH